MSTRTTIFLFVAVMTLGALILGIERYFPSAVQLREMKRGPSRVERDKVTLIEIADTAGAVFKLQKATLGWELAQGQPDLADPEKVNALLQAIDGIEWVERVHREEFDAGEWAKTGLDKPRHKVRLMVGASVVSECWFGAAGVMDGGFYIGMRSAQEPDVGGMAWYLARTTAPAILATPQASWRDPKLLRVPTERIVRVTLTRADGQIELFRENEHMPWVLLRPLKTRAGKDRVNEILSALLNIEVLDAREVAASKNGPATSATTVSEEVKVRVDTSTKGETFEMVIKKPAGEKEASTTATVGHRKAVFTVSSKNLFRLWGEPNRLRDHLLAQINADVVRTISISSLSFPEVKLRNNQGTWFLERHGKWEGANGERLARMIEALNTHEIVEYSADTAADLAVFGLDKPFQTITWTYPQFRPIKLHFGSNADSTKFYVKYEDEPFVYRIEASLLPSLPPDSLKWKGLGALRFSTFALRRITLSVGANPPLVLNYKSSAASWTGTRAGKDISADIDRIKADRMAGMLSKLTVQDWSASRSEALLALKTPYLRIQLVLGEPGKDDGPVRQVNLALAPTQPNADTAFFYGQVEGDADVFYISRKALLEVMASPFKDKAGM